MPCICHLNPIFRSQDLIIDLLYHQIKYANAHSIPFLAINGGHGTSSYLNNIKSGIGIYMRGLKGVSLNPLNSSQAVVLGGTISAEAVSGFASFKKQSTAGGCDCTGFTSPMLGGGHGWLQYVFFERMFPLLYTPSMSLLGNDALQPNVYLRVGILTLSPSTEAATDS